MAHDPNYIKWVQRSLNRLIASGIAVDGNPSEKYRQELGNFKVINGVEEPGLLIDQIGKKCQDEIIKQNVISPVPGAVEYVGWLKKVIPTIPKDSYGGSPTFAKAIRDFQIRENAKPGQKLEIDGVVGFKTEFRLIQISKIDPPGSTPQTTPKPKSDPFIDHLNSMTLNKRYGFMISLVARDFAEGNWDPRVQELAKRLGVNDEWAIPQQYFFTDANVLRLVYGGAGYDGEGEPRSQLQKLQIDGGMSPWAYDYYDLNDSMVERIVQEHFMVSAQSRLHPYYAYKFISKEHFELCKQKMFEEVLEIHRKLDIGIGKIKYLRDKEHGDPLARLAYNLVKGLSMTRTHIYGAYKTQMPGGYGDFESPLPVGRKW